MIVDPLEDLLYTFSAEGDQNDQDCHHCRKDTDGRYRKTSACVCYQKDYRDQENTKAHIKCGPVFHDGIGIRAADLRSMHFILLHLSSENKKEVQHREDHTDQCDHTGIGEKVSERQSERCPDDDIGRIAAHGSGTAEVGTENLRHDHRHRIKLQQLRQFDGDRCQKQHNSDAVDKHGQHAGHDHKAHKKRNDAVMNEFCQCQA